MTISNAEKLKEIVRIGFLRVFIPTLGKNGKLTFNCGLLFLVDCLKSNGPKTTCIDIQNLW